MEQEKFKQEMWQKLEAENTQAQADKRRRNWENKLRNGQEGEKCKKKENRVTKREEEANIARPGGI